jgi:hypothetical protein
MKVRMLNGDEILEFGEEGMNGGVDDLNAVRE